MDAGNDSTGTRVQRQLCSPRSSLPTQLPPEFNIEQRQMNLLKIIEDSVYAAQQLEQFLYGDVLGRIPVCLFTDSESTLESVASSKQILTQTLRMTIVDLKERRLNGKITSITWLPTERMWVDLLMKEKRLSEDLENVLIRNVMNILDTNINKVRAFGQEVKITNIRKNLNGYA